MIQKHSTDNTQHSKYKYTYYQNTHTLQKKLQQPQYKIHTKWNSPNTIKYPRYVILMYFCPQELHRNFTSLQNKITSHKSCQFTPHHYTSLIYTVPTCIPLLV